MRGGQWGSWVHLTLRFIGQALTRSAHLEHHTTATTKTDKIVPFFRCERAPNSKAHAPEVTDEITAGLDFSFQQISCETARCCCCNSNFSVKPGDQRSSCFTPFLGILVKLQKLIALKMMSIDSPGWAGQFCFWVGDDRSDRWTANSRRCHTFTRDWPERTSSDSNDTTCSFSFSSLISNSSNVLIFFNFSFIFFYFFLFANLCKLDANFPLFATDVERAALGNVPANFYESICVPVPDLREFNATPNGTNGGSDPAGGFTPPGPPPLMATSGSSPNGSAAAAPPTQSAPKMLSPMAAPRLPTSSANGVTSYMSHDGESANQIVCSQKSSKVVVRPSAVAGNCEIVQNEWKAAGNGWLLLLLWEVSGTFFSSRPTSWAAARNKCHSSGITRYAFFF